MECKISVKNLSVSFEQKSIIKNLSLDIDSGENLFVIGGSGSGKSVLVKSIVGILPRLSGVVKMNSIQLFDDVVKNVQKHQISVTFQNDGLFDSMNVMQNLCFALLKRKKVKKKEAAKIAKDAAKDMGLDSEVLDVYPHELSGGMRKRIAVARGIITLPKIIFFDEPTTGLDPITSDKISGVIHQYTKSTKVTSVIITHDINHARRFADKIAVMKSGKIIWHDKAENLQSSKDPYVKKLISLCGK